MSQEALAAFKARRDEALTFLRGLKPEQWERGGIHATRGKMTVKDFVELMAWHDDNHLDQLKRALDGKPTASCFHSGALPRHWLRQPCADHLAQDFKRGLRSRERIQFSGQTV